MNTGESSTSAKDRNLLLKRTGTGGHSRGINGIKQVKETMSKCKKM